MHMSHPPEHYAKLMIEDLDTEDEIDQLNSLQLLQLLQKVSLDQIVSKNGMFEKYMFMTIPWKPLIDVYASEPFIPGDPTILISEGSYNKVIVFQIICIFTHKALHFFIKLGSGRISVRVF